MKCLSINVLTFMVFFKWPLIIATYFFLTLFVASWLLNHLFDCLFFDKTRHPEVSLSIL